LKQNLVLILGLAFLGGTLATGTAFWVYSSISHPQEVEKKITLQAKPLISKSRAKEIQYRRSLMRTQFRSSHNKYLLREKRPEDMIWLTSQAELTLLSGLFSRYVEITGNFFEILRIMANDYLNERWQVRDVFERELLPAFNNAERRKKVLVRRIEYEPALQLFRNLSYIAYHDSIAINAFDSYLNQGNENDFTVAVDYANTTKLMLKDFWQNFRFYLNNHDINFQPSEEVWNRYFGPWDRLEP